MGNKKDQSGLQERQRHKDSGSLTHPRGREIRQQFPEILFDENEPSTD